MHVGAISDTADNDVNVETTEPYATQIRRATDYLMLFIDRKGLEYTDISGWGGYLGPGEFYLDQLITDDGDELPGEREGYNVKFDLTKDPSGGPFWWRSGSSISY